MKTIAFYISNHGFGHATRNIPIIQGLLENDKNVRIIVKTKDRQLQAIKEALAAYSSRIDYYVSMNDIGLILKEGSIEVDEKRLGKELKEFIKSWERRIPEEAAFLTEHKVELVVSDITPWVLKSASIVNVKSLFISNFTWVEIYREYFEPSIYERFLECYQLADKAYIYPFAGDIRGYFKEIIEVGMSCRPFDEAKAAEIKRHFKKPVVYVSVGRSVDLKTSIDVEKIPYIFLYTEGINLEGVNAVKIPVDTNNTQDYIRASDYVITKAGWSTVAEALNAEKPMLVIKRDEVAEDRRTLGGLLELDVALPITSEEFNAEDIYRLLLELEGKRENYQGIGEKYKNQAAEIANSILEV
jgi:hypothetical protein